MLLGSQVLTLEDCPTAKAPTKTITTAIRVFIFSSSESLSCAATKCLQLCDLRLAWTFASIRFLRSNCECLLDSEKPNPERYFSGRNAERQYSGPCAHSAFAVLSSFTKENRQEPNNGKSRCCCKCPRGRCAAGSPASRVSAPMATQLTATQMKDLIAR